MSELLRSGRTSGPSHRDRLMRFGRLISYTRLAYHQLRTGQGPDGEVPQHVITQVAQDWAKKALATMNVHVVVKGAPANSTGTPVLFVSNHISYLDIPLWFSLAPISFVAKQQVRFWPWLGSAAALAGTTFVVRRSQASRAKAAESLSHTFKNMKRNIIIFPEGTTSIEGLAWRHGSLRIAQESGVKVQAARLTYNPVREIAYIDQDTFVPHLWNLFQVPRIDVEVEFREPMEIKDFEKDTQTLRDWVQAGNHKKLQAQGWKLGTDPTPPLYKDIR